MIEAITIGTVTIIIIGISFLLGYAKGLDRAYKDAAEINKKYMDIRIEGIKKYYENQHSN